MLSENRCGYHFLKLVQFCPDKASRSGTVSWATAWQNQQNSICAQRRLRSACASAQSDQNLRCPWVHSYPLNAQRRLWSDWAHGSFSWFYRASAQLWSPYRFLVVETILKALYTSAPTVRAESVTFGKKTERTRIVAYLILLECLGSDFLMRQSTGSFP